jgi:pyrroloquinoline quinone biosynthesis protein D
MDTSTTLPKLARLFRLQWEPAQDAYVLLYPEGMVKLNQSAAEILKLCDGNSAVATIVSNLERTFEVNGLSDEVQGFMQVAYGRGWLV